MSIVPKSCIFYLVNNNGIHLNRLQKSLELLNSNFLDRYPYPVVFGHEGISEHLQQLISSKISTPVYFHQVPFDATPVYPSEIAAQIPEKFKGHWDPNAYFSMGYRHMCRYFAGAIYKDLFFEKTKYMLRLDCDSYLIDKVSFDPFAYIRDNNIKYATIDQHNNEMEYVVTNLKEFLSEYFGPSYQVPSTTGMFETNFELVDFEWFRGPTYMKYFDHIDRSGNIYIRRWGDAPLKYQGVCNMLKPSEVCIFKDRIPYKHGGDL